MSICLRVVPFDAATCPAETSGRTPSGCPTPQDRPPGVSRSNTEHHIRSKGPKALFRALRPAAPRPEKELTMPVNQDLRCQLEADVSLAVVCFGDELQAGASRPLEFLRA